MALDSTKTTISTAPSEVSAPQKSKLNRLQRIWAATNLQAIYWRLGGRSWLLIVFFAVTAFALAWRGKLTADYAAVITALSGFHIGRAIASDYYNNK